MSRLVYLDVETTGLDPDRHEVWEIAYAVDDGPVRASFVSHRLKWPDPDALRMNRYLDRWDPTAERERYHEADAFEALAGATLVGANPAFDAAFLRKRWGDAPWHHRLLDVESYAMGVLGYDRPQGLAAIRADLAARGFDVPEPDHTAAGDVACLRACHKALQRIYARSHVAVTSGAIVTYRTAQP